MPWCPDCGTEYEAGRTVCTDCGAALVETAPAPADEDPVVVLGADSVVEAQVAEATLEAEGIEAYVQPPGSLVPNVDVMGEEPPELEVLVAAEDAERARQVLSEPPVTEEELAQASAESEPPEWIP